MTTTIPGPRGNWLLGVVPSIRRDSIGFLMETFHRYGDVSAYRIATIRSHLIAHPDGVRHVLQENVKNYTKDHISYDMVRWTVGNGLLTSQGSFWLRQRRLAQPAFHRQRIAAMGDLMVRAAAEAAERLGELASGGRTVDIGEPLMQLTLRIAGETLFGAQVGTQADAVSQAFNELSAQLVARFRSFNILPPKLPTAADRRFRAAQRTLDQVVYGIIAERRRREADTGDLLSMLMLTVDEETGERMDDAQLRDEVLTMLIAGHETTATALTWTFGLLAQHPEAEAKLRAELDAALGGRLPSVADLPSLPYTRMVIDEAMRLYPPVYILSRKVIADDTIGGRRIPAGSSVDISPYVTHRHPAFWDDPERFDPERFTPERVAARPRYAYFPFSGGPRQCIGNSFALMEAPLLLATIAQRLRMRLAHGAMPGLDPLATLRPKGGMAMVIEGA